MTRVSSFLSYPLFLSFCRNSYISPITIISDSFGDIGDCLRDPSSNWPPFKLLNVF